MTLPKLNRVRIAGFRSLRDVSLDLTPVTVLIGPNGAGKSNILWALEMVRMLAFESLQLFVSERGGATYLMHYGPQRTPSIDLSLEFTTSSGEYVYEARLGPGADESLLFLSERAGIRKSTEEEWRWSENPVLAGAGHRESLLRAVDAKDDTAKMVRWLLRNINFYHFHDTSRRSPLRTRSFADVSGAYLRSDGSNLPVFLLGLRESEKEEDKAAWLRLMFHVTSVAPFIKDLVPVEDRRGVVLEWVDEAGATFGPAHFSDGTLRAIALFAALEQPRATLPLLSCIDEPELGLHPAAIELFASTVRSVASDRQVILSTQSTGLLDQFEAEQVVVTERRDNATVLRRLAEPELAHWLAKYKLSELFEGNLIGGRP